eukprot:GEMP01040748.1.p1 GENE.GEMP01040748.1~~GEMP01040748.1.p1  ORF type:complete len:226 (+),score=51.71 GEMP01040748.1:133-810(+)
MFAPGISVRRIPSYQRQWSMGLSQEPARKPPQVQLLVQPKPQPKPQPKLQLVPQPKLQSKPQLQVQQQSPAVDQESPFQQKFQGKSGEEVVQLLSMALTPTQLGAVTKVFSRRNAVQGDILKGVPPLRRSLGTVDRAGLLSAIRCVSSLTDVDMEAFKILPRWSTKELEKPKLMINKGISPVAIPPRVGALTSAVRKIESPSLTWRASLQKPAAIRAELDWMRLS